MVLEREEQCKDHKMYKDSTESLLIWLNHAKQKIPSMKERSLSDKLAIENVLTPLENILNTKAQGEALWENVQYKSAIVLPNTSEEGQKIIKKEVSELTDNFSSFFQGNEDELQLNKWREFKHNMILLIFLTDVHNQKAQLEEIIVQWKAYKEEYERISDWLQQIEDAIKMNKTTLYSNVPEKENQVSEVQVFIYEFEIFFRVFHFSRILKYIFIDFLETL